MDDAVTCPLSMPLAALMVACGAAAAPESMELNNGVIRLGVDLRHGGAIALLAPAEGAAKSLINSHDPGRYVQPAYYSGPQPFGEPHIGWPNWPWNPIVAGDVYGNGSAVLAHQSVGDEIYIKTRPLQWALKQVPCDCTIESWISLQGPAARLRYRLTNQRTDTTLYPARQQELPAVYTVGRLRRIVTYSGAAPFSGGDMTTIDHAGPPWKSLRATEQWAALVDEDGRGVGVFAPGVHTFIGGFARGAGGDGPRDDATGYLAPVLHEILDHNVVMEHEAALVVGSVEEIRNWVYQHARRPAPPRYEFKSDRQRWWMINASDGGWPVQERWNVRLEGRDPQLIGPVEFWRAAEAPVLRIDAAYQLAGGRGAEAEVFFDTFEREGFPASHRVTFPVVGDGVRRVHIVKLADHPAYQGVITRLRLDPVAEGQAGETVRIHCIEAGPR